MSDQDNLRKGRVASLERLDNGIIKQVYLKDIEFTTEDADELLKLTWELEPSGNWFLLLDQRSKFKLPREARNYFADNMPQTSNLAFLVASKAAEVAGNFFIRLNKPEFPARIFNDEKAAEEWLVELRKTRPT